MRPSAPSPPGPSTESTGTPIARNDNRSARLRRQSERWAHLSRYALGMTGAVTLGAALALWFLHPSGLAIGLVLFGLVLVALGLVQHFLLVRERRRWPDQAYLWPDGVELVLHNGEVRAVEWDDPKLAFDLFRRPVRDDPSDEILLEWRMGGYVPPCSLTQEGFDRLQATAVLHDLGMAEFRHGSRPHEIRIYEVRPRRRVPAAIPSSPGRIPAEQ
jgi:hypothetical protein